MKQGEQVEEEYI